MKRKKLNKILSICFVLILAGAALVSGTFAMNAGGIEMLSNNGSGSTGEIELIQEQRTDAGFTAYTGDKQLVPVVDAIYADDATGYPVNTNFVDRFVTVQNSSSEDLYIRVLVAMPAAFDDPYISNGQDPINIIFENDEIGGIRFGKTDHWHTPELIATDVMCGNTLSNIYSIEYKNALTHGARADGYAMYGVYIHNRVSNADNQYTFNNTDINYDIDKGLDLKIKAQGIQTLSAETGADPFALVDDNPWDLNNSGTQTDSAGVDNQ